MADIINSLLAAYKVSLASYMQSGQTLSWARYACVPGETDLTDWWGLLPLILFAPTGTTLEPDSMEGTCRSDKKVYSITFNVILEAYDASYGTKSPNVPDMVTAVTRAMDIETIYNRNTLDLSQGCVLTSITYGTPTFPGFTIGGGGWIYGVNLNFEHLWQDRRYT